MGEIPISLESLRPDFSIGVLGPIGVGKSTLSRQLGARLGVPVLEENFGENPHLPDFYRDPRRFAYISQTWFLTRKIAQLENFVKGLIDPDEVMDELYAETLFRMELMDAREWSLYQEECAILKEIFGIRRSDIFVRIEAPTEVLKERIRQRGRPYELLMLDNFPGYLDVLNQTVRDWEMRQPEGTSIISLDTGQHDISKDQEPLDFIERTVINLLLQKASK